VWNAADRIDLEDDLLLDVDRRSIAVACSPTVMAEVVSKNRKVGEATANSRSSFVLDKFEVKRVGLVA
jgi:hypothetical protein